MNGHSQYASSKWKHFLVATATVKLQDAASKFQDRTPPYINGYCQTANSKWKHLLVATATVKLQDAASKLQVETLP
jgi:hypothetical protein